MNGGWGCLMGDEGSGYHIGLNALRHCAEQMDGTEKPDLLSTLILHRECGIPSHKYSALP
ncbi:MAG: hypothetical protein IJP27_04270 [Clostridia bacterium]|nr:hypothetical protein [Clostridia bacterium]